MRTYRMRRLLALLTVGVLALGGATLVTAGPAAATPVPVTDLHPDGTGAERYVVSPVRFSATRDPADGAGRTAYVVQRRRPDGWHQIASQTSAAPVFLTLPNGGIRWHARSQVDGEAGPWSPWIELTVDSRTPAAPLAPIPSSGTVGRPLTFTASSPGGLATAYYLSEFGNRVLVPLGDDPCTVEGYRCPARPGGPVTFSVTVMKSSFIPLQVYALGRNGLWSDATPTTNVIFRVDDQALADAARWPVQDLDGTTVPEVHGGPALTISPNAVVSRQGLMSEFDQSSVAVPSLRFAQPTVARTAAAVVDTASAFTVGVVVRKPSATPTTDLTVLSQAGADGPAFTVVLTPALTWRFCVTTTDAATTCTSQAAFQRGDSDSLVASWSPDLRQIVVAGAAFPFQPTDVPGTAPVRPAAGGLVIGSPPPPAAGHYLGLIGSPFVAAGVVSPGQFRYLLGVR